MDFIYFIQQFRSPFWDAFFRFWNFFDTSEFLFVLIPAVWFGYSWRAGSRLFYALMVQGLVIYFCKQMFALPRPFFIDPSVGVIHVLGFGFPSGAASSAVLLAGILLYYRRTVWTWVIAVNFVFWMSLSRLYLGVHFPIDILGGWMTGLLLLGCFIFFVKKIEAYIHSRSLIIGLCIGEALPMLGVVFFFQIPFVVHLCAAAQGIALGLFLCSRYQLFLSKTKIPLMIVRAGFAVLGCFALFFGMRMVACPIYVESFVLGLWISYGFTAVWRGVLACN